MRTTLLAVCVALAGCTLPGGPTKPPTSPGAKASKAPGGSGPGTSAASGPDGGTPAPPRLAGLAGEVRVLVATSRIVSDNGSGVVANNGSSIISNNSGAILSNNGGTLVANNGGGLVGKVRYGITQLAPVTQALLADATVTATDAAGKPLLGADGQPIVAKTDAQGRYRFHAPLPGNNVVLRVALGQAGALAGGELATMVGQGGRADADIPIDTATTLGAAYVLTTMVQGQQATFDRLSSAAADQLHADLRAATGTLKEAPRYEGKALVSLVEGLREAVPAVRGAIEAVRALLLGQAARGDGRPATQVALSDARGLALDAKGRLLIGEKFFGRIRAVGDDGRITSYADHLRGEIRRGFPAFRTFKLGPDGSTYVINGFQVMRITPDGQVSPFAGTSVGTAGTVGGAATGVSMAPHSLAVAPDGTVYIGEDRDLAAESPARLLAVAPDGTIRDVPIPRTPYGHDAVAAIALGPDGTIYLLLLNQKRTGQLYALPPAGAPRLLVDGLVNPDYGDMVLKPDGTLIFTGNPRVEALSPGGALTTIAGVGGPPGTEQIRLPESLLLKPDGSLVIIDGWNSVVSELGTDGQVRALAGTSSATQGGVGLDDLALSTPSDVAFDASGRMLIAPSTGRELVALADGRVSSMLAASMDDPMVGVSSASGVTVHDGAIYVIDYGHHRILKVDAAGGLTTFGGGSKPAAVLKAGERLLASESSLNGNRIAVGPDGLIYWSSADRRQIYRIAADGMVELVAGVGLRREAGESRAPSVAEILAPDIGLGGPPTQASLVQPSALAFDAKGDLLIADAALCQVFRVTAPGTPAARFERAYGLSLAEQSDRLDELDALDARGEPGTAVMSGPMGLAFDAKGNLYVSEVGTVSLPSLVSLNGASLDAIAGLLPVRYARVRRFTPDGRHSIIAGPGSRFFADPQAPDALLTPTALAVAPDGRLAICDTAANLVRILPAGSY